MNQIYLLLWSLSICAMPITLYYKKGDWFYGAVVAFLFLSINVMIGFTMPNYSMALLEPIVR